MELALELSKLLARHNGFRLPGLGKCASALCKFRLLFIHPECLISVSSAACKTGLCLKTNAQICVCRSQDASESFVGFT